MAAEEDVKPYAGMSLRDIYVSHCHALQIKPNSRLVKELRADGTSYDDHTTIDLGRNYLGRVGFQAFLEIVRLNTRLKRVVLTDNGLSNDATVALCRVATKHPSLTSLDLSNNPLSLTAGQALLDLVRKNPRIINLDIAQTSIEQRLSERIEQGVNSNSEQLRKGLGNQDTPFRKVQREWEDKKRTRPHRPAKVLKGETTDADIDDQISKIPGIMRHRNVRGPRRTRDGWVILNVFISTTKGDFSSELGIIHHKILPTLNRRLARRKVWIHPFAMHHDPYPQSSRPPRGDDEEEEETPLAPQDLRHHVGLTDRCYPIFIGLYGDRYGWVPHTCVPDFPEYRHLTSLPMVGQTPISVLEAHHGYVANPQDGVQLLFLRKSSQQLKVPEGIMESMSDNYNYHHPDPEGDVVVWGTTPDTQPDVLRDPVLLMKRWDIYNEMKDAIRTKVQPAMLVDGYTARFTKVDEDGTVVLSNLEQFERAFASGLWQVVNELYPPQKGDAPAQRNDDDAVPVRRGEIMESPVKQYEWKQPNLHHDERRDLLAMCHSLVGRKAAMSRLDLYLVSPTSRNMLLVTSSKGSGMTTLATSFIRKTMPRPNFVVCYHIANNCNIADEPWDLRSVLLGLCKQMLPEGSDLPPSIVNSIDIQTIKQFWLHTLKTTASTMKEGKVLVIVVDGLDAIRPPPQVPEEAAEGSVIGKHRTAIRGVAASSTGSTTEEEGDSTIVGEMAAMSNETVLDSSWFDWIPICLQRNVRLIGTMHDTSVTAIHSLAQRGVDSCEVHQLQGLVATDAQVLLLKQLAEYNLTLDDEELEVLMGKTDVLLPQYLTLVCHLLVYRAHRVTYERQYVYLNKLPPTLPELVEMMLRMSERECGTELLRRFVGLILCSREGLLELELRELLVFSPVGRNVGDSTAATVEDWKPLLSGSDWSALYYSLSVFLHPFLCGEETQGDTAPLTRSTSDELGTIHSIESPRVAQRKATNGTNCRLHFNNATFVDVAKARYVGTFERERDMHMQLARYYKGKSESSGHPLLVMGAKEYTYHMIQARMWSSVMQCAFTIHHMKKAYQHHLGYVLFREYQLALGDMYDFVKQKMREDPGFAQASGAQFEAWMERIREGIDFLHLNNTALSSHASLVYQQAFNSPVETTIYSEALEYYHNNPSLAHCLWINKAKTRLHDGPVVTTSFSANGLRLMTASADRTVKICNAIGNPIMALSNHNEQLKFAMYSNTSKYLVAVSRDRTVSVYDASTGSALGKLEGHLSQVVCCDVSHRGRYIATGSEDRTMRIWESETVRCLACVSHTTYCPPSSPYSAVNSVSCHPSDENFFATACDKTVLVWRLAVDHTVECVRTLLAHTAYPAFAVRWSPTGSHLLTCARIPSAESVQTLLPDNDTLIKVWSFTSGRLVARMMGAPASESITSLSLSFCQRYVAVTCNGNVALVWPVDWHNMHEDEAVVATEGVDVPPKAITPKAVLRGHANFSLCCFSHCSKFLATACADNLVQVWSVESGHQAVEFMCSGDVTAIHWTPAPSDEGGHLVCGDDKGKVYVLKAINLRQEEAEHKRQNLHLD